MRGTWQVAAALAMIAAISAATAQDLSGPLARSDASPLAAATKPDKTVKHIGRRTKAATTSKRTTVPIAENLPSALDHATDTTKATAPTDPVSFGMKWNGSNDSAGQTRIENLNGGATGTSAEVGMKLHF